jgi:ribosomal protein S18 acetylase RimI-like enzyme
VACKLYKQFNFQIAGTIPDYYKNPTEDGYLMIYKKST